MINKEKTNRRSFLKGAGTIAVGFSIFPSNVISGLGHIAPSDKLNIAGIGIGGKGAANLRNMSTENIVALCDVDWGYSKRIFETYPKAKRFWDFRKMLDRMGSSIDAVVIATPDHTHCVIAADAILRNKHVYLQKPLTHSVYESRLLTKLADRYKIATQMGNESASHEDTNIVVEWIQNGEIGEVRKVEAFSDRPIWPQGLDRPKIVERIPDTLNWELFVGPAKMVPYNSAYTPWAWRGWWEFGTGALGDMACHILDPVYRSLRLKYPTKIQGTSTIILSDSAPNAEMNRFIFPAREKKEEDKIDYPEVEVIWYDGGLKPPMPEGWPAGKAMDTYGSGVIYHGSKDTLICGLAGANAWLLSGRKPNVPKTERRVSVSHEMDWVRACKEDVDNRVLTKSNFSFAGPFNEMVVLGVPATRLQGLNRILNWDGENMRFTNINSDETLKFPITNDFSKLNGEPTFEKTWTEPINARLFAEKLIKHDYENGWSLPGMPA